MTADSRSSSGQQQRIAAAVASKKSDVQCSTGADAQDRDGGIPRQRKAATEPAITNAEKGAGRKAQRPEPKSKERAGQGVA